MNTENLEKTFAKIFNDLDKAIELTKPENYKDNGRK
jgi:hypothetical protein